MQKDDNILKIESYVIYKNQEIGRGQFGTVYQCQDEKRPTLRLCAKIIEERLDDPKTQREIDLMKMLMTCAKGNKNIVGVEQVFSNETQIVLILEKCESDLQTIIDQKKRKDNKFFHPNEALNILKQVINGYRVLYTKNVIHRDLKPANILVLDGVYKIADLGLARVMETTSDNQILTKVGTPKYVAPQLYVDNFFSNSADIFSLGIITYELIFGGLPYVATSQQQIRKALRNLEHNPIQVPRDHPDMTNDFAQLIEMMLKFKESDRISWTQLFRHPLIIEGSTATQNKQGQMKDNENDNDDDDDDDEEVQQPTQTKPNEKPQVSERPPNQPVPTFTGPMPSFPIGGANLNPNFRNLPSFIPSGGAKPFVQIQSAMPRLQTMSPGVLATPSFSGIAPNFSIIQTGQNFQFVQAQSDQLYQIGVVMDQTLELLERFINTQIQLKQEYFGLKLYLHQVSQCFLEHSKAMKQNQQNQNHFYQLANVDQAIEKQKRYHQVISQELERYQINKIYILKDINPDYFNYLNTIKQILQQQGLFLYSSEKKYYLEYIQLLYSFEILKDLNQTSFEDLYRLILDVYMNQKTESVMIELLNKKQQQIN